MHSRGTVLLCAAALTVLSAAVPTASAAAAAASPTALTLTVSPPGARRVNSSLLFEVAIAPTNAVGTVALYDGSRLLGSGSHYEQLWSYATSSLAAGTHSIKATFTPDVPSAHGAATTTMTEVITSSAPVLNAPKPTATPTPPPSSTPAPTPVPTGGCGLSTDLVPSCGVLLGAYPTSFGGSNIDAAFTNFNTESGSTVSVGHDYRSPGQTLSAGDVALAKTPGALLLVNWKPSANWADAGGGNATVNSQIDAMAHSVQALGATKIIMTIFHEPENNVSGGAPSCPSSIYIGHAGTPAQYRAMWANVESRFSALGVTNVVWAMNYMGFSGWNCMVDDLWPGNNLVDWVLWDPYQSTTVSFSASVGAMYGELTQLTDADHDYLAKPWGLGEVGDVSSSDANQEHFYSTIAQSLESAEFPKLKLVTLFDAVGTLGDSRVAYDEAGIFDSRELADLARLDQDAVIAAGRASVTGGVGFAQLR